MAACLMVSKLSRIGTQGEHLTCIDIGKRGYPAFFASPDCSYDLVADVNSSLIRVQVKATLHSVQRYKSSVPAWCFNARLNDYRGYRRYGDNAYDILALAAIDIGKVAYMLPAQEKGSITLRSRENPIRKKGVQEKYPERYFEDLPFEKILAELGIA